MLVQQGIKWLLISHRITWNVLENPGIWSLQVLESPGEKHLNVCTKPGQVFEIERGANR